MQQNVRLACLLEATARKVGNVHPQAGFENLSYADFVASADAVAPIISQSASLGVGQAILNSVQATQAAVGKNTNLGTVLLLAPLAAAAHHAAPQLEQIRHSQVATGSDTAASDLAQVALQAAQSIEVLKESVVAVLNRLTYQDAVQTYQAIRLAQPGGMGHVERNDIRGEPTGTLQEMMRSAADRDLIAAEYSYGFRVTLENAVPILARYWPPQPEQWEHHIIRLQLSLMAIHLDSLIKRKCGHAVARDAARRSRDVLDSGWPDTDLGRRQYREFDGWLRSDGHRRNPGTTADIVAAALFVALSTGLITPPPESALPSLQ